MSAPAIIYLTLTVVGFFYVGSKHGERRTGEYDIFASFITTAFVLGLLYWGGFFA